MTFALRDYQQDMIDRTRVALRTSRRVLIQSPTGSGKTALAAAMLGTASQRGSRCGFLVHRQELIDQTIATFTKVGIPFGVIAAGYSPNPFAAVQIASIDTLKNRLEKIIPFDFLVVDEAHHASAAGWAKTIDHFSSAYVVGLSATPARLDGKGLDHIFHDIVIGPKVSWLMEQGFLADYRAFAPPPPDLAGVHTRMGDFARGELADAMDKPSITGDAVAHYLKLARDRQAVCFCISVQHSKHVADTFRAAGIMAWHLDGNTPRDDRRKAIDAYRKGDIKVLCNVDLFGEGFDLPSIDVSILLRPTKSLALYLQQVGRSLRPGVGKTAIILDHAGNIMRHGMPDDERQWSLNGAPKSERATAVRNCPKCFAAHKPALTCPECGHDYRSDETADTGRKVEQIDGELVEIDKAVMRRRANVDQARAQTLDDLIELGRKRGYKNPAFWASKIWTSRRARRAA